MSLLLLLGEQGEATVVDLLLPEPSFEDPDISAWVAFGAGVTRTRVADEEAPDSDHVLEVITAGEGWEGLGGVRTASMAVEPGSFVRIPPILVLVPEGRTLYLGISERNAGDTQIDFHEEEGEDAGIPGTGFWEIVEFGAQLTTGVKARAFFQMDGPSEPPENPIFWIDELPEVWPPPYPDLRFQDDFESGTFSKYNELQEIGPTAKGSILEVKPLVGTRSFKATIGPEDERAELYKLTDQTILREGDEAYVRILSRLEGDPGGIGVIMQLHNSGDIGTPPIELSQHADSGRLTLDGGPTDGVEFTIDWWGPHVADLINKRIEWIVGFKISADPEVGYVRLWMNRKPMRLTDDWHDDEEQNKGGFVIPRRTLHEGKDPYLYWKFGNYLAAGPTAIGSHVVDGPALSFDPAYIFTPLPVLFRAEGEFLPAGRYIRYGGSFVEV